MKLLVTGGAGYIGSYIIKNFDKVDEIKEITSLDNLFFNQNFYNKSSKIKNVKGDVRDKSLMNKLYKSHDIIIPLAAIVGSPACEKNINLATEINLTQIKNIISSTKFMEEVIKATSVSKAEINRKILKYFKKDFWKEFI